MTGRRNRPEPNIRPANAPPGMQLSNLFPAQAPSTLQYWLSEWRAVYLPSASTVLHFLKNIYQKVSDQERHPLHQRPAGRPEIGLPVPYPYRDIENPVRGRQTQFCSLEDLPLSKKYQSR